MVLNHVSAVSLIKDAAGKISGAVVRNNETGKEIRVAAKVVVNATGPFTGALSVGAVISCVLCVLWFKRCVVLCMHQWFYVRNVCPRVSAFRFRVLSAADKILEMDDPKHKPTVTPSSGVHVRAYPTPTHTYTHTHPHSLTQYTYSNHIHTLASHSPQVGAPVVLHSARYGHADPPHARRPSSIPAAVGGLRARRHHRPAQRRAYLWRLSVV